MTPDLLIGAHFSVAGGLENALLTAQSLDCTAVQIFTKNARNWKEPVLDEKQIHLFKETRIKTGVKFVASHCSYLINIAAHEAPKREKAQNALTGEMIRSAQLGLDGVVLHPGSHLGKGKEKGLETAAHTLGQVLARDTGDFPRLLLETTAGMGTSLGSRFEEIGWLLNALGPDARLGVCLDTSHIFAAGYDIRTRTALDQTLEEFDRHIGLSNLHLLHLNDSKPELGSFKDRHEHIGEGKIGEKGFRALMRAARLKAIPKILETPKEENNTPMDEVNINRLRNFAANGL